MCVGTKSQSNLTSLQSSPWHRLVSGPFFSHSVAAEVWRLVGGTQHGVITVMETVITWPHSGAGMACLPLVLQLCPADRYGGPRHMPRAVLKDLSPNPPYGAAATALSNMRLAEKQLILDHTLLYNGIIKHDSFCLSLKQLISTELAGNHTKQWPPVELFWGSRTTP